MRLGLKQKLYNAEVRNRRLARGFTMKQLANKIGVAVCSVGCVENLRICTKKSAVVQRLAKFFGVDPEILCPQWLKQIGPLPKVKDIQHEFSETALRDISKKYAALEWDREINREDLHGLIDKVFQNLSSQEQDIMKLRFGIPDGQDHTLQEIAKMKSMTTEGVRQVVIRSIEKLRRLNSTKFFRGFAEAHDISCEEIA